MAFDFLGGCPNCDSLWLRLRRLRYSNDQYSVLELSGDVRASVHQPMGFWIRAAEVPTGAQKPELFMFASCAEHHQLQDN
jgi:hypothetical protein